MTVMNGGPLGALPIAGGKVIGPILLPMQPKFSSISTIDQPNVTGFNTNGILKCDTIITNIGSGYNASTGVFTAPLAGFYHFSSTVLLYNLTPANDSVATFFNVNSSQYLIYALNAGSLGYDGIGAYGANGSLDINLEANDQVYIDAEVYGGAANTVGLLGLSTFSGYLIG